MSKVQNIDEVFRQAVSYIDQGDVEHVEQLIDEYPGLLMERFNTPDERYFANPYLLWFVANNPIRHETMPPNTLEMARMLIRRAKALQLSDYREQLEYTLMLVVSGRIPKEAGVQLALAALLIAEGARPRGAVGALAHNNPDAARFLTGQGEPVELITAVCLDLPGVYEQAIRAGEAEKELALVGAAFFGRTPALKMLIALGTNVNAYPDSEKSMGFHAHATALHQAVFAGSLEAVQLLVEAGADPELQDRIYGGTPLDWAEHGLAGEESGSGVRNKLQAIAEYLKGRMGKAGKP